MIRPETQIHLARSPAKTIEEAGEDTDQLIDLANSLRKSAKKVEEKSRERGNKATIKKQEFYRTSDQIRLSITLGHLSHGIRRQIKHGDLEFIGQMRNSLRGLVGELDLALQHMPTNR